MMGWMALFNIGMLVVIEAGTLLGVVIAVGGESDSSGSELRY